MLSKDRKYSAGRTMSALRSSVFLSTFSLAVVAVILFLFGFGAYAWHLWGTKGCRIRVKSGQAQVSSDDGACRSSEKLVFNYHVFSEASPEIGLTVAAAALGDNGLPDVGDLDRIREDGTSYFAMLENGSSDKVVIPCDFLLADYMKKHSMPEQDVRQRLFVFIEPCSIGQELRAQCDHRCITWALNDTRRGSKDRYTRMLHFALWSWSYLTWSRFTVSDHHRAVDVMDITHDIKGYHNLVTLSHHGRFRRDHLDGDLLLQQKQEADEKGVKRLFEKKKKGGLGYFRKKRRKSSSKSRRRRRR